MQKIYKPELKRSSWTDICRPTTSLPHIAGICLSHISPSGIGVSTMLSVLGCCTPNTLNAVSRSKIISSLQFGHSATRIFRPLRHLSTTRTALHWQQEQFAALVAITPLYVIYMGWYSCEQIFLYSTPDSKKYQIGSQGRRFARTVLAKSIPC